MPDDVATVEERVIADRVTQAGKKATRRPARGAARGPNPAQVPAHVAACRRIWNARFGKDLPGVVIGDLSAFVAKFAQAHPAMGGIASAGYAAWTNSSALVVVAPGIMDDGEELAGIALVHEARHVRQFMGGLWDLRPGGDSRSGIIGPRARLGALTK
jgi:hypothetical protein